jgi:hypothetical protein
MSVNPGITVVDNKKNNQKNGGKRRRSGTRGH